MREPEWDDDCVACRVPFPVNSDLASLPRGKRVAFDPALGRIWRICTACGHWNLAGSQAANSTRDELVARLADSTSGRSFHDSIGSTEILVVSTSPEAKISTSGGIKVRGLLRKGILSRKAMTIGVYTLLVGNIAYGYLAAPGRSQALSWQLLFGIGLGEWFSEDATRWALKQPPALPGLLARSIALVGLVFWVSMWSVTSGLDGASALGVAVFSFLLYTADSLLNGVKAVIASDGSKVRLSKLAMRRVALRSSPSGAGIEVSGLPGRRDAQGENAIQVVQAIGTELMGVVSAAEVEQGWQLLRIHGDVPGLCRALESLRQAEGSPHRWIDLPAAWKIALSIGAVEAGGSAVERAALMSKVCEASEIAKIAEMLDDNREIYEAS